MFLSLPKAVAVKEIKPLKSSFIVIEILSSSLESKRKKSVNFLDSTILVFVPSQIAVDTSKPLLIKSFMSLKDTENSVTPALLLTEIYLIITHFHLVFYCRID